MAKPCVACGTPRAPRSSLGCCTPCKSRIAVLRREEGLATFAEALALDTSRSGTPPRVVGRPAPKPVLFARPHFREVWEGED